MRSSKPKAERRKAKFGRSAFTLMELLIVMLIIAILAGLALAALQGATEQAREARTRAIVAKIDQLIRDKWESYKTRAVPINTTGQNPRLAAQNRLLAMRKLQRLELPDRNGDLYAACGPELTSYPSATRGMQRKIPSGNNGNESAECLYAILSTMKDGDKSALEFFMPDEIGDEDGDGVMEIHDAWGMPIGFIRWPAGYIQSNTDVGQTTPQTGDAATEPDPFDPVKVDSRWSDADTTNDPYAIFPLIVSGGPDKIIDLEFGDSTMADPYQLDSTTNLKIGTPDQTGDDNFGDNITNHYQPNG